MALTKEDLLAIQALLEPINKRLESLETSVSGIETDIAGLKTRQESVDEKLLRIELEQFPRINAALDGVASSLERIERQGNRISALEDKTEDHDQRIFILEQVAQAQCLRHTD